jgi:hypothetical protein
MVHCPECLYSIAEGRAFFGWICISGREIFKEITLLSLIDAQIAVFFVFARRIAS